MKDVKLSQKLTESGLMLALTTILSVLAIAKLPYGGSITFASMLPMTIIAYRYGFAWGLLTGATYGLIQMLLGLDTLSYATSAAAVVAIIVLDYILAFMSTALGGFFNKSKNQVTSLTGAALLVCVMRYFFHVISGCTVWAGLSIPSADALLYSIIYNATYMLPEMIITCVAAVYLSSSINFRTKHLTAAERSAKAPKPVGLLTAVSGLVILGAVTAIVALVFPHLQDAETGSFNIQGISQVNTILVVSIAGGAALAAVIMYIVSKSIIKKYSK